MAAGYDGTIRIDTHIDDKGFNKGVETAGAKTRLFKDYVSNMFVSFNKAFTGIGKALTSGNLTTGLTRVMGSIKQMGTEVQASGSEAAAAIGGIGGAVAGIAAAIVVVIALIAAAVISFVAMAMKITESLYKSMSTTSAFRDQVAKLRAEFVELKGNLQALGANLLAAVAPALMTILNWLSTIIDFASQWIAALRGQSTYYKYTAGSAEGVASSTAKIAKNTEKANKAAKGALASWDELNVLQQETSDKAEQQNAGGGGGSGNIQMTEIPIEENIVTKAQKIREFFEKTWTAIKDFCVSVNDFILQISLAVFEWVKQAGIDAWEWIKTAFADVVAWFGTAWVNIKNFAVTAWNGIVTVWQTTPGWFKTNVTDPIAKWFSAAWDNIKLFASNAWLKISGVWGAVSTWFKVSVIDPLKSAFATALDWIQTKWQMVFTGISTFVKGTINKIIDFLNSMIAGVTSGINAIISGLNSVGKNVPGFKSIGNVASPQIPRLATGAVIPPNSQFLALLGDQKSGTNIEAPLSTIEDAVRNAIAGMDLGGDVTAPITITLDSEVIYQGVQKVQRRKGTSLITSGAPA